MDTWVYLYGMTVWSTVHRLAGHYPAEDTYGEIVETHRFPGGETGNSALILARLGYRTRLGGPHLGAETRETILAFYADHGVDCSGLAYDESYPGVRDLVLVAGGTRTVFGWFGAYFSGPKRWSPPDEEAIRSARMATIDPYFGDDSPLAAEMCVRHGVPYVTIDCEPDSLLHQHSCANVVSNEFLSQRFPSEDRQELLRRYADASSGLTVFTRGSQEILFSRRGGTIECVSPFRVEVKSTLGAGDVFRAGVVHGLLSGMSDRETVRFAAATSACVCRRFPMAFDPPGLAEIESLLREG